MNFKTLAHYVCTALAVAGCGGGGASSSDAASGIEPLQAPAAVPAEGGDREGAGDSGSGRCRSMGMLAHTSGVPHHHGDGHGGCNEGETFEPQAPAAAPPTPDAGGAAACGRSLLHTTGVPHSHGDGHGGCVPSSPTTQPQPTTPGPAGEHTADGELCGFSGRPRFAEVGFERFGEGRCGTTSSLWDFVRGTIQQVGGNCRLIYTVPRGTDEQDTARVETHTRLAAATGMPLQSHLKMQWTEHFVRGYEFPFSQKIGRFFVSAWGHTAEIVILGGTTVQGALYVQATNGALLEVSGTIEFPGGIPVDRDIPVSLEVQMPGANHDGWIELSFDGRSRRVSMSNVRSLDESCIIGFDGVWVGGNWTNRGTVAARDSRRYIDDVRIFAEIDDSGRVADELIELSVTE